MKKNKIVCIMETKGILSETGAKGWWYPCENKKVSIKKGSLIEHMETWRHQGDYLAFRVRADDINKNFEKEDKHICVWIEKNVCEWLFRNQDE